MRVDLEKIQEAKDKLGELNSKKRTLSRQHRRLTRSSKE